MRNKPIIVVAGEPYSIFFEIFFKSLKKKSIRSIGNPIILVASKNLLIKQMNALKYKFILNEITFEKMQKVKQITKKEKCHFKTFERIPAYSYDMLKSMYPPGYRILETIPRTNRIHHQSSATLSGLRKAQSDAWHAWLLASWLRQH